MRKRFGFLLWIGLFSVSLLLMASGNQGWSQREKTPKQAPVADYRAVLKCLDFELDMQDFQQQMNLKEALEIFRRQLAAKGHDFPLFVNTEAFKEENPDAPNIYDTQLWFAPFPKRMLLRAVLRQALTRVNPPNATYIIRDGAIEITTYESGATHRLIKQRVVCDVVDRPLAEALQDLAERSGVSILVDPRTGDRAKTPVSARFRGDLFLEAALHLLADMAELKAVVLPSGIYVTTPENAEQMRKDRKNWLVSPEGNPGKEKRVDAAP